MMHYRPSPKDIRSELDTTYVFESVALDLFLGSFLLWNHILKVSNQRGRSLFLSIISSL